MRIKIHPFNIIARLCKAHHLLVLNLLKYVKQPGVSLAKK